MRIRWTIPLVAVAAFFVTHAVAQQGQQPQQQPMPGQQPGQQQQQQSQRVYEATKHFAVIYAGMRDAQLNSDMLAQISQDPRSYDREHGELFLRNIQQSLAQAQTHLEHLRPLATTPEETQQIDQLNQTFVQANKMSRPMRDQLGDANAIHGSAQQLNQELQKGMQPLRQVATQMDAKIQVG